MSTLPLKAPLKRLQVNGGGWVIVDASGLKVAAATDGSYATALARAFNVTRAAKTRRKVVALEQKAVANARKERNRQRLELELALANVKGFV